MTKPEIRTLQISPRTFGRITALKQASAAVNTEFKALLQTLADENEISSLQFIDVEEPFDGFPQILYTSAAPVDL